MILRLLSSLAVWVVLFRRLTPGVVLSGILVALLATWLVPERRTTGIRPLPFLRLAAREAVAVARATVRVAATVLRPHLRDPGLVEVELPGATDRELAWVASLTTLSPGTFVVDTTRPAGVRVHALDASAPDRVAQEIRTLHADVAAALRPSARTGSTDDDGRASRREVSA